MTTARTCSARAITTSSMVASPRFQLGREGQAAGEPRTRSQKIVQGIAVKRAHKRQCRLAERVAQHTTFFDPAESGLGKASHHGEFFFGVAHDSPDTDLPWRARQP